MYQRRGIFTGMVKFAAFVVFVLAVILAVNLYREKQQTVNKDSVVDSLTPGVQLPMAQAEIMHTSTPSVTPHLRLTQIEAEKQEAASEVDRARLQAESIRLVADAGAYEVSVVSKAQAEGAERILKPTQTAQSIRQTDQVIAQTEQAFMVTQTVQAGNSRILAAAIARQEIELENAAFSKSAIAITGGASILAMLVGSAGITGLYHRRREALEQFESLEPEPYYYKPSPPLTREEYHNVYRSWANNPEASPTSIAGMSFPVSGNPSTVMIEKSKTVKEFIDHSPTRFGYNDFLHDYSSRSRKVVNHPPAWGGGMV